MQRREGVVAAGACLIVAAAYVGLASRSGTIPAAGVLLAPGDAADRKLLQLGGLIGEVSAVKHALLAIAGRERGQPQQLTGGRPALSGGLPAPVHTDSFDYPASVGGASQIQHGEWSRRSGNDDRLEMIPRRSKLRRIDKLVAQDACNWPECVTRSGLAPGTDLFPGDQPRPEERGESIRDAKRQMTSVYHELSKWIAGGADRDGESRARRQDSGPALQTRSSYAQRAEGRGDAEPREWPNLNAKYLQAMEPAAERRREMAAVGRGAGSRAPRVAQETRRALQQMRKSDLSHLVEMSPESQREARAEERGEAAAAARMDRAEERQRKVGTDWREPRQGEGGRGAGGSQEGVEREASRGAWREEGRGERGAEGRTWRIPGVAHTYEQRTAGDKKKLAAERLLAKQQREMGEMRREIAHLKHKTHELKAAQTRAEREGHDEVARLTTVGAETSREFRREVEKEASEVAGKVAAQEVKKALAAQAAAGGDESGRVRAGGGAARGEGLKDGSTAGLEEGVRAMREARKVREAREAREEQERREGRWEGERGQGEQKKEARYERHVRKEQKKEERKQEEWKQEEWKWKQEERKQDERKHVVRAVPVQTAVAVAEAVAAADGGHPALRAAATPLVMARALQDKEKGVVVSKQALHVHEEEQGGRDGGAGGGDDLRGGGAGARHTQHEQALARSRKVAAEGAEMLPRREGAREEGRRELRRQAGDASRAGARGHGGKREAGSELPRSLAPHALSKR